MKRHSNGEGSGRTSEKPDSLKPRNEETRNSPRREVSREINRDNSHELDRLINRIRKIPTSRISYQQCDYAFDLLPEADDGWEEPLD